MTTSKKWLPYLLVVIAFALISSLYFLPSFDGYQLNQGDITSYKGMSKEIVDFRKEFNEEPLWSNAMFGGMPSYQTSTSYQTGYVYIRDFVRMPFSYNAFMVFLAFLAFFVLLRALKTPLILAFFGALLYGLSTYNILIIEAGHNTKMHAIATIPFVLASLIMLLRSKKHLILYAGFFALTMGYQLFCNHIQMTYYFAFVLGSICIAEAIKASKNKTLPTFGKKIGLLLVGAILAVSSNFASIYLTKDFATHTMRGPAIVSVNPNGSPVSKNVTESGLKKDYITQWSYGIGESYNLLVPNAKGNSRHLTSAFFDYLKENEPSKLQAAGQMYQQSRGQLFKGYWGNQPFTSGPNYIGAIVVFLALLYVITVNKPLKWALLIPTVLALMLSWGKNMMWFTDLFIDYMPLYNKFRTVSSFLVVLNLTLPLMAILFIKACLFDEEFRKTQQKKVLTAGLAIIAVVGLLAFMPFGFDFLTQQEYLQSTQGNQQLNGLLDILVEFRKSVFRSDSLQSAGFMLLALALIYGFWKDKLKANWLVLGLGLLMSINLWMLDKKFLNNEKEKGKYTHWIKTTPLNHNILASAGDLSIYQLESSQNTTIQAVVDKKSKAFKKEEGRRLTKQDKESLMFSTLNTHTNYRVLNLDNPFNSSMTSYFHKSSGGYSPAKLRRYQDMIDFYISDEFKLISSNPEQVKTLNMLNTKYYLQGGKLVFKNPHAFGNAWYVSSVKLVESDNDEILEFKNINPKQEAIVHKDFENQLGKTTFSTTNNQIRLTDYKANHLQYQVNNQSEGLAVFSEIYYEDGWNAYVDGKKVDHLRANYLLRALKLPAGDYTVEFKFEPSLYSIGNWINIISFVIILLMLALGIKSCLKPVKLED